MNTLQHLRKLSQSLWLDSISREMLDDGRLARYVREFIEEMKASGFIAEAFKRHGLGPDDAIVAAPAPLE